jgi:hypothetical protein
MRLYGWFKDIREAVELSLVACLRGLNLDVMMDRKASAFGPHYIQPDPPPPPLLYGKAE